MIKGIVGMFVIVASMMLALYVGGWVLCIQGIVQIVEGIKANPVSGLDIGIGLFRFFLAAPVGWFIGVFGSAIGCSFIDNCGPEVK